MPEGGCLCGELRYAVDGPALDVGYCHCTMCRRSAGAPVNVWGVWPARSFRWLQGQPTAFESSADATRSFCPRCGTQLLFVDGKAPELVEITIASLDEPAAFAPVHHIWTPSRIPWFETADTLPRYPAASPHDEQVRRRASD